MIVTVAISCYIPVICGSIQDFVTYIDSQSFTVYIVFCYYWLESSFGGCRSNILVFLVNLLPFVVVQTPLFVGGISIGYACNALLRQSSLFAR